MAFHRLVRFVSETGSILYGDVTDAKSLQNCEGATVAVVAGDIEKGFSITSETATVKEVSLRSIVKD
jgi:hypothetical protein